MTRKRFFDLCDSSQEPLHITISENKAGVRVVYLGGYWIRPNGYPTRRWQVYCPKTNDGHKHAVYKRDDALNMEKALLERWLKEWALMRHRPKMVKK